MARRSQAAVATKANAPTADKGRVATGAETGANGTRIVVFQVGGAPFGFRLDSVAEIVRVPALAHMPLAPRSLLGLANLRGVVLPVVDLRRLLGLLEVPIGNATRVIVIDWGAAVGFAVDRIDNLMAVPTGAIEKDEAGAGAVDPDLLDGVVKGAEGTTTIKILNPQRLLRNEFSRLGVSGPRAAPHVSMPVGGSSSAVPDQEQKTSLLSFQLGQQEFALPLDRVREIIPLPDKISEIPRAETAVLGVVTWRGRLLPLVSLRALLGLPNDLDHAGSGKVVVMSIGNGAIGLVADRTREILRVEQGAIEPAPALLTRGTGDAEITSICRLDHGKRLVAILSPDRLFRSELVRRVVAEQENEIDGEATRSDGDTMADEQFVIFRLGDQEYGLPVGSVEEIARSPDHITRLPKAPAFIEGVINLHGAVVPIVDLRRRFELISKEPGSTPRILVLVVGQSKTGFMVDSVSEVLRLPAHAIRQAPEVSVEQMRLIGRVANLEAQGRMILLIDPAQLLSRVEADVLAKFDPTDLEQTSRAS